MEQRGLPYALKQGSGRMRLKLLGSHIELGRPSDEGVDRSVSPSSSVHWLVASELHCVLHRGCGQEGDELCTALLPVYMSTACDESIRKLGHP